MRRPVASLVALPALALAVVACGDDGGTETINSGQAAPTEELLAPTTTTSEPPDDGDGDDRGDDGDGGDGQFEFGDAVTIDCEEDDSPSVSGSEETVLVSGPCREVTIAGAGHRVLVESADHVEVSGSGHRVVMKAGDELDVDGSGHDVQHPPGATVDNTSSDSHVTTLDEGDGGRGDGGDDGDGDD